MSAPNFRGIVVIDVGASNVRAILYDPELRERDSRVMTAPSRIGQHYTEINIEPVIAFAKSAIEEFDKRLPVDVIVPCAHGSALALIDEAGQLALPIIKYTAQPDATTTAAYKEVAPPFEEVFAPTNPMSLTLGLQLFWQQSAFPAAFANVKSILPLAQYLSWRLSGELACDVSALGAQTHLWAPLQRDYSSLAKERGWAKLFAPVRPAWQNLGRYQRADLAGCGDVLTGVHDSNANFFRYHHDPELALVSTGTWIIVFEPNVSLHSLDAARDQVSNSTILGDPIACARFMGGEEFGLICDGQSPALISPDRLSEIIDGKIWAAPSFTDSGGPLPDTGGKGSVVDLPTDRLDLLPALATIYAAQMTAITLGKLGSKGRIVVDGPFSQNTHYLEILSALLPDCQIFTAPEAGTSIGAAMLAFLANDLPCPALADLEAVTPSQLKGLKQYHQHWLDNYAITPRRHGAIMREAIDDNKH